MGPLSSATKGAASYLTLPRHIVGLKSALIEGYQEVGAAVAVLKREAGFGHCLSGGGRC